MQIQLFPHFNRIITAPFLKKLLLWSFLALISAIFLLNFSSLFYPLSPFRKASLAVLRNYYQTEVHLDLAEEYLSAYDLENARRELILGLSSNPTDDRLQNELTKVENLISAPGEVLLATTQWEEIVRQYPDFRDAYLKLSQLYFQLYQNEKVKENLEKALEIDPNFEPAKEMEKLF